MPAAERQRSRHQLSRTCAGGAHRPGPVRRAHRSHVRRRAIRCTAATSTTFRPTTPCRHSSSIRAATVHARRMRASPKSTSSPHRSSMKSAPDGIVSSSMSSSAPRTNPSSTSPTSSESPAFPPGPRDYGAPTFSAGYVLPTVRGIGPRDRLNQLWQVSDNLSVRAGAHALQNRHVDCPPQLDIR